MNRQKLHQNLFSIAIPCPFSVGWVVERERSRSN